ncbi:MAG: zinc-dependent alcohol dehydrogenase family protein [Eubacteriales bacterium]|nr:zinc-dependent alcohol dehydrogenase family protein [Eubacteriales bacterium]
MKAFFIEEPNKSDIREIEIPVLGDTEVLIKVMAVGVCGTDVHLFLGDYDNPYPTIPGHEYSGIVEAVGAKVKNFKPGQKVACDPNIYCEACDNCKQNKQNYCLDYRGLGNHVPGAFAEYMKIEERCVYDIGNLSFTEASFIEPLACVIHGHDRARPNFCDKVLILGAGPIGLMHLQVCKNDGAMFVAVADIKENQLALAQKLGADYVIYNDAEAGTKFRQIAPNGFDLVIDCTGVPKVIENIIPFVANEGTLQFFGVCPANMKINVSPFEIYQRELKFVGSNSLKKTFYSSMKQIQSGKVKVLDFIGYKIELDEFPEQLKAISERKTNLKTIVYPNGIVE